MSDHPAPALLELAAAYGVSTDYWDWQGTYRPVATDTIVAVLAALGVTNVEGQPLDPTDDTQLQQALTESWQRHWRRTLPPCVVLREGWTPWVKVHVPHGESVTLTLVAEDGSVRDIPQVDCYEPPRWVDGAEIGEATFELPGDLPLGWHQLRAHVGGRHARPDSTGTAHVIVTPHHLALPESLADQRRWGVMAQVYQVRSQHSWGIGDLTDLAVTAQWAAGLGADFSLINPLHASGVTAPLEPSPYLPSTRRFASPLYLDVTAIVEYQHLTEEQRQQAADRAAALRAATSHTIDRDSVWQLKSDVLADIFACPRSPARQAEFTDFCQLHGSALTRFATWCVLTECYGPDSRRWPPDYQHPDSAALASFQTEQAARIDFYRWLQWLLEDQQRQAHHAAVAAGMAVGIISDLAVGVHPHGADSWAQPELLVRGVAVGAPPDAFNQLGQNWHQPPWHPHILAEHGYLPFRDLIRTLLAGAGGLRIDHIIGLFRLWWIPDGAPANGGAYVHYDYEALLGILVLEAHRAQAVLIGEDLGSVQPQARQILAERGILGTSVLWFEFSDGHPLPAADYRRLCLATVTTHDLPPTAGYLDLIHVDIRARLGLLSRPEADERAAEAQMLAAIGQAVTRGSDVTGDSANDAKVLALHQFLAATPAILRGVALADMAGDRRPINQPGTTDEYPNWRLPLAGPDGQPVLLEQLMAAPLPTALAQVCNGR